MAQRKALGRGLSALLGTPEPESEELREIDINRILPNSQQPRKNFRRRRPERTRGFDPSPWRNSTDRCSATAG